MSGWFYRKLIVRLLELDDTPKEIARGIAIGVFIAMTPTVGIQMITIALVCTIFHGNRLAGVSMAWISNPLTIVPIYWLDYVIGSFTVIYKMKYNENWKRMYNLTMSDMAFHISTSAGLFFFLSKIPALVRMEYIFCGTFNTRQSFIVEEMRWNTTYIRTGSGAIAYS